VAVEEPEVGALKVTVPGPDNFDHAPAPIVGVLPPNEPLTSVAQKFKGVVAIVAVVGVA
jgi:hypothetical protein